MTYLLIALVVATVVAYLLLSKRSQRTDSSGPRHQQRPRMAGPTESSSTELPTGTTYGTKQQQAEYLRARWAELEAEHRAGTLNSSLRWFMDEATDRQLTRLKDEGNNLRGAKLTKGQASDLIGLSEPIDEDDAEVLRFFKAPLKGTNQTIGRYEAERLLRDPDKRAAWETRPPGPLQKEYLKFFGITHTSGTTLAEAERLIAQHRRTADSSDAAKLADWQSFEYIVKEFWDPDSRDGYDIKKPSLPVIKAAIDALQREGKTLQELEAEPETVADKLIEMKPSLERS